MSNFKKIFTLLNAKQFLRSKNYLTGISLIIIAGLVIGGVFYFKMESQKAKGAISTEGLVLWLKMDDNAGTTDVADSSVENNTCTAQQNTNVLSEVSLYQRALTFNGSSDYINCGNGFPSTLTGDFTISMWVKLNSIAQNHLFWAQNHGANIWHYSYWNSGVNKFMWHVHNLSGTLIVNKEDNYTPSADTWIYLTWRRSGTLFQIFENSNPIAAATDDASVIPLYVGDFEISIASMSINGAIDGFRIYNRAVSAEEIALHYFLGSETRLKNAVIKNAVIR